jgi:hypothetical protein
MSVVFSENWKTARQITQTTNARRNREELRALALSACGMTGKYPLPRPTKDYLYSIYDMRFTRRVRPTTSA